MCASLPTVGRRRLGGSAAGGRRLWCWGCLGRKAPRGFWIGGGGRGAGRACVGSAVRSRKGSRSRLGSRRVVVYGAEHPNNDDLRRPP